MIGLILAAALTLVGFNDGFKCTVRGTLYLMPGEAVTFARTDGCRALIHHEVKDGALHLWSDSRWVVIPLPEDERGHVELAYFWGSKMATIHGHEWWKVSDGPTGGG